MECTVYRSRRKRETYLYLPRGADPTEVLPEALRQLLGGLDPVMDLTLSPQRRLARADVAAVMTALEDEGYYLQLPPPV